MEEANPRPSGWSVAGTPNGPGQQLATLGVPPSGGPRPWWEWL